MVERKVLTTGEIAKYCGVNFRTVIRWIQRGQLRAYKLPGRGDHRVEIYDFIAFLKDWKMPVPKELEEHVPELNAPKVLIVEDEPVIVDYIEKVCADMGFQTIVAQDGFQAGVLLATHQPRIVTLDLSLPGMNGFEVLRYMKDSVVYAQTRILVISGKGQDEIDLALRVGAHDSLAKPFGGEDLKNKLSQLMGRTESGN